MKIKGRGILVLCLLLFGGFAVFDYYREKSKEESDMQASRLMLVNFDQVDEVRLQRGEQRVLLKRTIDGWLMEAPVKDNADSSAVEDLIKSSFTEKIIEVAKEGADIDWKMYGLDSPLGSVTFITTEGRKNVFEISGKLNFEDNVFARRDGEDRVLVLNSVWQQRLLKPGETFRDRRFFRHKMAAVDELQLKNKRGLVHLRRQEGRWFLVNRPEIKVDQNGVRSLLSSLAEAQASEILAGARKGPVLKSLFTLDLLLDQKKWNAQVGQASDLGIFATVSEPSQVMKLEPGALDHLLTMTPEDLREKPAENPSFQGPSEQKEN